MRSPRGWQFSRRRSNDNARNTDRARFERLVERGTSRWWVPLLIGILWLIYAFIVLSFTYKTVWAVVIFAGIAFIAAGIVEFVLAAVLDSWQWLHALAGVLCIAAGIVAFAWPGQTFLVMAGIIGWFLLFRGTFNIVESLWSRTTSSSGG